MSYPKGDKGILPPLNVINYLLSRDVARYTRSSILITCDVSTCIYQDEMGLYRSLCIINVASRLNSLC